MEWIFNLFEAQIHKNQIEAVFAMLSTLVKMKHSDKFKVCNCALIFDSNFNVYIYGMPSTCRKQNYVPTVTFIVNSKIGFISEK